MRTFDAFKFDTFTMSV